MIQFNYENCLSERIGKEGINRRDLKNLKKIFIQVKKNLSPRKEYLAFSKLPDNLTQAKEIKKFAYRVKESNRFHNFVVIGIGGSALGNRALQDSLNHPYWNFLSKEKRRSNHLKGWLRLFVLDNIDPDGVFGLAEIIDLKKTFFNIISKSGETTECLANFAFFRNLLEKKVGDKWRNQVIITTDEKKGYLRRIAQEEKIVSYSIPENLGGRYSVLSPVGLVSAAFTGIDIEKLLHGAEEMRRICSTTQLLKNPAGLYAAVQYLLYQGSAHRQVKNISVMLAYSNRLYSIADWYRQLWAESLGKTEQDSHPVGPTPIKALGVTDQHSQLQLYLDGPKDKVITFLSLKNFAGKVSLPEFDCPNLSGKSLNQIFHAEEEATRRALTERKCPNCTLLLPLISPRTIGQIIYFFELATAYAGEFLGVNPFDQPAVELIKKYTKKLLSTPHPSLSS